MCKWGVFNSELRVKVKVDQNKFINAFDNTDDVINLLPLQKFVTLKEKGSLDNEKTPYELYVPRILKKTNLFIGKHFEKATKGKTGQTDFVAIYFQAKDLYDCFFEYKIYPEEIGSDVMNVDVKMYLKSQKRIIKVAYMTAAYWIRKEMVNSVYRAIEKANKL